MAIKGKVIVNSNPFGKLKSAASPRLFKCDQGSLFYANMMKGRQAGEHNSMRLKRRAGLIPARHESGGENHKKIHKKKQHAGVNCYFDLQNSQSTSLYKDACEPDTMPTAFPGKWIFSGVLADNTVDHDSASNPGCHIDRQSGFS